MWGNKQFCGYISNPAVAYWSDDRESSDQVRCRLATSSRLTANERLVYWSDDRESSDQVLPPDDFKSSDGSFNSHIIRHLHHIRLGLRLAGEDVTRLDLFVVEGVAGFHVHFSVE